MLREGNETTVRRQSAETSRYLAIALITALIINEARSLGLPEAQSSPPTRTSAVEIEQDNESTERVSSLNKAKKSMSSMSEKIGLVMAGKITLNFGFKENRTPENASKFIRTLPPEDQREIREILRHIAKYPEDQDEISKHCCSLLEDSIGADMLIPLLKQILEKKMGGAQWEAIQTLQYLEAYDSLAKDSDGRER